MFSVEERERVREAPVEKARGDERISAAAAVGSSAVGGDRWSDLDLTFGVAAGWTVGEVLADWAAAMIDGFGAAVLFDLPVGSTIYRVFLLPGMLQVDLSFTPAAEFGARGPRFALIFGEAVERAWAEPPSTEEMFGLGVHHLVRARFCIERGRLWQAGHWIHEARELAMTLACRRFGLNEQYGRGFDDLPLDMREMAVGAIVREVTVAELRQALAAVTEGLLREGKVLPDGGSRVRSLLDEIRR